MSGQALEIQDAVVLGFDHDRCILQLAKHAVQSLGRLLVILLLLFVAAGKGNADTTAWIRPRRIGTRWIGPGRVAAAGRITSGRILGWQTQINAQE